MDELLEQFLIEGRELVTQAARDFAALTRDPLDAAAIDSAFRAIHTLKGSFAIFALAPAERLLHAAEDVLDRARRGADPLDAGTLAGLVACLDQTDRWIDDMERTGALDPNAGIVGDDAIALLTSGTLPASPPVAAAASPAGGSDWAQALTEREATAIANADMPLVAFRYEPDAECFFRGDDPLAVVEAVPGLIALAMLPEGGHWPDIDALQPFSCFSRFEGLSSAPVGEVRAAFRLQPDQVVFAEIPHAAATAANDTPQELPRETGTLRVAAARVDALADDLGDLVVAVNGLPRLADEIERIDRALAARLRATQVGIDRATAKLHRNLSRIRLVPLEPALRRLPRLAREIAEGLGKDIAFSLSGETIEVDKQIADALFEPLLHLVRNAMDHGIETAAMRRAAGKQAQGRVALSFAREGDAISAVLSDDGAGIDPATIRRAAIGRGLISPEAAAALDDAAALRLIFLPGFSTARAVTEISGRGVGMDAVQATIARLRGSIVIESEPGVGTRFRIRLPVNALTTRLLVVEAGGERYGVSLDQVAETVRIDAGALMPVGSGLACVLRGRTVPVLDLARLLDAAPVESPHARLVVTHVDGRPVALRVDQFSERIDTVLRPPRGILASAPGVIGSAILGDGGVLIVLDLPELAA